MSLLNISVKGPKLVLFGDGLLICSIQAEQWEKSIVSLSQIIKQMKQPQLIIYYLYETCTGYFLNVKVIKSTTLSSSNHENTWDYKQCYIGMLILILININCIYRAAFQNIICLETWLNGKMQSYSRILGKDRRQQWTEEITLYGLMDSRAETCF